MSTYHQILMPIDGSPTSDKALDEAIRLAQLTGARLRACSHYLCKCERG